MAESLYGRGQATLISEQSFLARLVDEPAVLVMLGVQATVVFTLSFSTWVVLQRASRIAMRLCNALGEGLGQARSVSERYRRAWETPHAVLTDLARIEAAPPNQKPLPRGTTLEAIANVEAVLPKAYNSRLDVAAPGVFTALGIFGTFVGLIIAFAKIDPSNATEGVGPLVRGMSVAFVNSLLGVGLAVSWTLQSRVLRHKYDVAAGQLLTKLRQAAIGLGVEPDPFLALQRQLATMEVASVTTARDLPTLLREALRGMATAPFESLAATVEAFARSTADLATRQQNLLAAAQDATEQLTAARRELTTAADLFGANTTLLALSIEHGSRLADTTAALIERAGRTGEEMTALEGQVSAAQNQLRELLQGLGVTREALVTTSDALAMNADQFRESSGRLDSAVAALAAASAQAVDESMETVREELQAAVQGMISGMTDTSQRTVAAYEDASRKVAEALDEQMTDLADRLRGELATLAAQLPAEMQKLHEASAAIKGSVDRALKSLDAAVGQLSSQSTEVLRAHLVEYERAVASAITHFSGTLTLWEARTAALEQATTGLADVVHHLGQKASADGKGERQ